MSPKRSIVWEFYKKKDSTVAVCTVCKKDIRFHGSTRNLMGHLKRKHHQYLQMYEMANSLEEEPSGCVDNRSETEHPKTSASGTSGSLSVSRPSTSAAVLGLENPSRPSDNQDQPACATRTTDKSVSVAAPRKRSYQTTITGTMKLKELTETKIKEIDSLLVDSIAEGYLPFSLVENKSFTKLINVLEPRYKLPSRKTLRNKLVSDHCLEIRETILEKLKDCKYVALTSDMWTSINTEGFVSVTAHFVHGGKLHTAILATKQMKERHTGENIALAIKAIIEEWGISGKVVALVTDNASVMVDVAKRLGVAHLGCAAHKLNLVVSDVFNNKNLEDLALLRQKCRKIVTFFKNSTIASSKLVTCQEQLGKAPLKLKQEVTTRWNSTYTMMQRLVQLKDPLIMSLSYVSCGESLTATDWDILVDCVDVLEPLFELTEEMSGEKYATSSIVIPLVRGCQKAVRAVNASTSTGIELQTQVLDALSRRMTPYETDASGICAKATILDPRFKKCGFGQPNNAANTVNQIISEVQSLQDPMSDGIVTHADTIQPTDRVSIGSKENKKKKIWKYFLEEKEKVAAVKNSSSSAKEDMRIYLSQPLVDLENDKMDPFTYWKKYEESLKELSSVAFKYLCVPATSVPSERVFSKTGEMYSERRNRLKGSIVDKMVFLNSNQKYGHSDQ